MVALPRRIFESSGNVAVFQRRIILENLRACRAGREQVKHVLDTDTKRSDAGTTPALAGIDGMR